MRPHAFLLALAAGAFLALGGEPRSLGPSGAPVSGRSVVTAYGTLDGTVDGGVLLADDNDPRARAAIRRELRRREAGTYISEMLASRDSALARWAVRARPITVWVQGDARGVEGWTQEHPAQVRAAFEEWNDVALPVRFAFTRDSSAAEVHVVWTERFAEQISGRTRWARDDDWWITDGVITLAVHHHQGLLLDGDAVRAMALHEIGHLLGLDHTENLGSVMARRVRVRAIAPVDRATAALLYAVPAGRVR